jgi:two-component system alkaline phosphatase synthesis response regulator PhoP
MTKILVIEDEPGIAFGLESDLQTEGYEVAVVGDGAEGVRRARGENFDLILLDVMLPTKDGFEVCRELRRGGLQTPIILLTAKTQEAEKILGLDVGADDYVSPNHSARGNCGRGFGLYCAALTMREAAIKRKTEATSTMRIPIDLALLS